LIDCEGHSLFKGSSYFYAKQSSEKVAIYLSTCGLFQGEGGGQGLIKNSGWILSEKHLKGAYRCIKGAEKRCERDETRERACECSRGAGAGTEGGDPCPETACACGSACGSACGMGRKERDARKGRTRMQRAFVVGRLSNGKICMSAECEGQRDVGGSGRARGRGGAKQLRGTRPVGTCLCNAGGCACARVRVCAWARVRVRTRRNDGGGAARREGKGKAFTAVCTHNLPL
jgi:hypothetical protein